MGKQFEDDEDDMDMYVTIEFDDGSEVGLQSNWHF